MTADLVPDFDTRSVDALVWANAFASAFTVWSNKGVEPDTAGLMLGWFANAIMAGFDEAQRRAEKAAQPAPVAERVALADMEARKDAAYLERNRCVALIARMAIALGLRAGIARTAIEGWSDDWHGCVYIDLPTGQVSWHFHDSQAWLFAGLPAYPAAWDGHDTPSKYERVAAAFASPQPAREPQKVEYGCWPIAKLTVDESGLVQHASLYAPGLPAGEHDVWLPGSAYEPAREPLTEAERKGAERYRWLRGGRARKMSTPPRQGRVEVMQWDDRSEGHILVGDALDIAVDAAIERAHNIAPHPADGGTR